MFNSMGGFYAVIQWRDQGNSDMVDAWIDTVKFAGQKTARQNGDVLLGKKLLCKIGIGDWCFQPHIKTGRRFLNFADISKNGYECREFFTV